jgi:hypothetical protein
VLVVHEFDVENLDCVFRATEAQCPTSHETHAFEVVEDIGVDYSADVHYADLVYPCRSKFHTGHSPQPRSSSGTIAV